MERIRPLPPNVECYAAQIAPLAGNPQHHPETPTPNLPQPSTLPPTAEITFDLSQNSENVVAAATPDAFVQECRPHHSLTTEGIIYSAEAAEPDHDDEPQPTRYNTSMGQLTFAELYAETQRIAGWVMREQLGMTNPEDIDDCLQAGYLKVWQKLQKDPDWLADKPKRYVVQAVVLRSKAQRFSHQRHYRKLVYDAQVGHQPEASVPTPQQVETWIDMSRAVERVAEQAQQTESHLLGLYCLVTQATITDVSHTFGYSHSTIQLARKQMRATLGLELSEYGQPQEASQAIFLPRSSIVNRPNMRLITPWLLEDGQAIDQWKCEDAALRAVCTDYQRRQVIRAQIHPFERQLNILPTYPTRWNGQLTLEAILSEPQVRRAAYAKLRDLGLSHDDQEDCVQRGCIKLWQQLETNPELLADKGPIWAGIYVAYSGYPSTFLRAQARQRVFDRPEFDWQAAEEYLPLGEREHRHTDFTLQADERLDIGRLIRRLAEAYGDDTRKLLALYALTTSVRVKDVAAILRLHEKNFAATIGNRVKRDLQVALMQEGFLDNKATLF